MVSMRLPGKRKGDKGHSKKSWVVELGDSVEEWKSKAAEELEELRKEVAQDIEKAGDVGTPTDDLFLLRFILSADGHVDKAAKEVREALKFRKEHLADLRKAVFTGHEIQSVMARSQCVGFCGALGADQHPLFIVRSGASDAKNLMQELSVEDVKLGLVLSNEIGFQLCDARTRSSGKIIKMITAVEASGFSMSRFDTRFIQALGKSSHISQTVYPQLLGLQALIGLPSAVRFLIRMVNKLQNKRAVEKQRLCPGRGGEECPFLKQWGAYDQVPEYMGGKRPAEDCPASLLTFSERSAVKTIEVGAESSVETAAPVSANKFCSIDVSYTSSDANTLLSVVVKVGDMTIASEKLNPGPRGSKTLFLVPQTGGSMTITIKNTNSQSSCTVHIVLDAQNNFVKRDEHFFKQIATSTTPEQVCTQVHGLAPITKSSKNVEVPDENEASTAAEVGHQTSPPVPASVSS